MPMNMILKKLVVLFGFIAISCCSLRAAAVETAQEITPTRLVFGVVPQQAASTLARSWAPVLAVLSQNAKLDLQFATAPDIPTFERRLARGDYDIAYMNPYHFTVFNVSPGYVALAKEQDKYLTGLVVVRKDSPISKLTELDDKLLAFPAPAAFAASVIPRAILKQNNITHRTQYVGSHDSVYLAVAQGLVDAGGGVGRTFNNMDANVTKQLKVLWRTPGYTPHAIATHPRVSELQRDILLEQLMALSNTHEGQMLLSGLGFKAMEAASSSDWDDVRALKLSELEKPLKEK
ncbi:phosphate ABC transporter substrate-binding protein [Shewanella sairae]|uniref:Phosphate ABC transporter substrate-binding protein n=1 Tax=Shewanella sairae TaxID=190310 RepID=A0ABQ4PQJ1_9GAMM|nr:PhnD/SsuA/transferrin family substrate-binding protein [Shewanella sairae]MCL1131391.1 phosphate/phosphite/phosphonate ABC transporter substrate-binding protein [Shewanella sairae]GIU51445.1 phosphate ABC transporter substrate-binding protein [Shewanella sairae]